jgi:uncharacterized protein
MAVQEITGTAPKRIEIIDSLRGFSLWGILISHLSIFFEAFDATGLNGSDPSIPNIVISIINGIFFSGKFFAIFSFLFGLSFYIQMDRAAQKGINFQWRFLWRIIILMAVGFLHSLLFSGDILIIYAILGVFLVFMFKVKNSVIIFLIIALLAGLPRFIGYGIKHLPGGTVAKVENASMEDQMNKLSQVYRNGSFQDVVKFNAEEGFKAKADYQLGIEGRGYQTLALFFLGLLVGRTKYFERMDENMIVTRKLFKRSIWFTLAFMLLAGGLFIITKGDMEKFISLIAMTFYNLFNLSFALLITTAFIIIYQGNKAQKFLQRLSPYGKMGLTNYLMQSIIFVPIFYGFGLGLATKINLAMGIILGMIIFYVQVRLSKWWLNHFIYGPFEWLWRSLTWLKWQPMKRTYD